MNYPSINEYKEAILFAEDNFEQLKNLRPVLVDDGSPVMTSGNFAVVFKMKDEQTGKLYAVKCFLREQEGREEAYRIIAEELEYVSSTFLTPIKYLDKELYVDTNAGDDKEFPVLLMDWVEGETLDKYIRKHLDDQYELSLLAYQFSRLAMWLMPQSFAHGDLKPDNILVKNDGTLVLVDYDGMYVPAMKGQKARELGSPDFRHPSRTEADFDEHIDDFSLASILLSLKAISLQPSLLEEYGAQDRLLFSANDYRNLSESEALNGLRPLMQDSELASLYSLFILALSQNNLSQVSFRIFNLCRPKEPKYEDEGTIIENGLLFTNNKKQLIKLIDRSNVVVTIPKETRYVKDNAFILASDDYKPHFIRILNDRISYFPTSARIFVPNDSVKESLVKKGFYEEQIVVGDIFIDEYGVAYSADKTTLILYPHYLEHSEYQIIEGCNTIEEGAFHAIGDCDPDDLVVSFTGNRLESLYIPSTLKKVGECAFDGCMELKTVIIPKGTRDQFEKLLPDYKDKLVEQDDENLSTEVTQEDLANAWTDEYGAKYSKDKKRFLSAAKCISLKHYTILEGTKVICKGAFYNLQSSLFPRKRDINWRNLHPLVYPSWEMNIQQITIPNSIVSIGEKAFHNCKELSSIFIPQNVKSIGKEAFSGCEKLASIIVDDRNLYFDSRNECNGIIEKKTNTLISVCSSTIIPKSVSGIGDYVFSGRLDLQSIIIPDNIRRIGKHTFWGCSNVKSVFISKNVNSIGEGAFAYCTDLALIEVDKQNEVYDSCNSCNAIIESYSNTLVAGCYNTKIAKRITRIWKGAFLGCKRLTTISIPKNVSVIDEEAFCGCENLETVELQIGLIKIKESAFRGCRKLNELKFPNTLSYIGDDAFTGCSFKDLIYPHSLNYIGDWAFYHCDLERVFLPNNITHVGHDAFSQCLQLRYISLSSSLYKIEANTFSCCKNITFLKIPEGIKVIDDYAFYDCDQLISISLPESLTDIREKAFYGCNRIERIFVPKGTKCKFIKLLPNMESILFEKIICETKVDELNDYECVKIRSFKKEEMEVVLMAEVMQFNFKSYVCFFLNDGNLMIFPLINNSSLLLGDEIDVSKAQLLTYRHKDKDNNNDEIHVVEA